MFMVWPINNLTKKVTTVKIASVYKWINANISKKENATEFKLIIVNKR